MRYPRYLYGVIKHGMVYRRPEPIFSFRWHLGAMCNLRYLHGNRILSEQMDSLTEVQILSKCTLCYTPSNGYTCTFLLWISTILLIINPEDPPAESQCQREDPCSLGSFMGASLFSTEALNRVSATRHSVPINVKADFTSDLPSRQSFVPDGDV